VRVKYWEIIADNLTKADWSWACVLAVDSNGRTIWIADAHRDNGKRFVVHAREKLIRFLDLESAIHPRRALIILRVRKPVNFTPVAAIQSNRLE
jgi:hypothetical protein